MRLATTWLPLALGAALGSSAAVSGCGAAASAPPVVDAEPPVASASVAPSASAVAAPKARTKSGEDGVRVLVDKGATAWGTIDVERARATPIAASLTRIFPFRRSLERAGISPQRDFDRMLMSVSPSLTLIEHRVEPERLEKFMDLAVQESDDPARREMINGHSCARLKNRNGRGTLCPIAPGLMIVTNNTKLDLWERLAAVDLPAPPNDEVAHFEVTDPRLFRYFPVETSLGEGALAISLQPHQGLRFEGRFASEHPSIDQKTLLDNIPIPGLDVTMEQGGLKLFLDVKPEDADALVTVLKIVGG